MSKHVKPWQEDWFPMVAGGLVTSGAIGCCVYGGLKYSHLETIAASLAGGIGVYLASSALLSMCSKYNHKERNPKSFNYDQTGSISLDDEASLCERFANVVNELDRKFDVEARKTLENQSMDKKTLSNIRKGAEEIAKTEDMVKRLENLKSLNLEGPGKGAKLPTYRKTETCSIEDIISLKAKFREELFSYINELKGYVQGTIDPLPSARKIQFGSTEINDEIRGQAVMIVKEYANSMLPRLEQVIDEFVDSVCISKKILEHKVKKASEILEASEKDFSTAEMKQFYSALGKEAKRSFLMPCQYWPPPKKDSEVNVQSFQPEKIETKTSVLPKPKVSTIPDVPLMSKPETPGPNAPEKLEDPQSEVSLKLTLNAEEINLLNLLKSEL